MTLITTFISNLGIIQASDSNLTSNIGVSIDTGPKVFSLGFADGAVAFAGNYGVGSETMEVWLPNYIRMYAGSTREPTLGDFSERLAKELESSSSAEELHLFHAAGYA